MTVTAGSNKVTLQGNGASGPPGMPFSLGTTFIGVNNQYIQVIYTDAAGLETVLAANQFTLTLTPGQPPNWGYGGILVYPLTGAAIASGTSLTVVRTLPLAQAITLQNQSSYGQYASASETAMDLLDLQIQQIATTFARALVAPPTDPDANLVIPNATARANQLLGFDGAGLPIAAEPSSALVSIAMQPVVAASTLAAARAAMGIDTSSILPIGTEVDWPGLVVPATWLEENGANVSRATYPELFNVLAPSVSCAFSNTSNAVTGLSIPTTGWNTGWAVEGTGIPGGTTIAAITGANAISLSNPASADGTQIRVFPFSNGNGTSTFTLPNKNGRVSVGLDAAGAVITTANKFGVAIGESTHTLITTEIPAHNHGVNDPGHTHPTSPNPAVVGQGTNTHAFGGITQVPDNSANLSIQSATTGITIQNTGADGAHNNVQPTLVERKIIYAGH